MDTLVREEPATTRSLRHVPFPARVYPSGHPADECPACHSTAMCWIANEALEYNYLCEVCGRCWTMGPSEAVRVDPMMCPPCDRREACLEGLRRELAASYWLPTGR